jgi:hypothetical protein
VTVSVLIPYRPSPERDPLLAHVLAWWASSFPDWQVVVGLHLDGPWVKAHAVADALTRASGDLLAVADGDVLCVGVGEAVARVQAGAPWAVPHRRVYRLTPDATQDVLGGGPLPALPGPTRTARRHPTQPRQQVARHRTGPIREEHAGVAGGGLVVLPRALYEEAPLDPRFVGFGGEDTSAGRAWAVLRGQPWRGLAPLWHLYHPPQPRLSRTVGSLESQALARRYRTAATPQAVRALLAEAT